MSYPFKSGFADYEQYYQSLPELAASLDKKVSKYCKGLDNVCAYSLDRLKGLLKTYRGCLCKSCDALYYGDDEHYYFIEFKDQQIGNIDPYTIRAKAIDSLSLAGFTFASDSKLPEIMKRSILVVVYDNPDDKTLCALSRLAGKKGCPKDNIGEDILWGLENLQKNSFFSEVHSWSEAVFRKNFIGCRQ